MAVEKDQLKRIIEGALFASDKPLTVEHMAQLFFEGDISSKEAVREALEELQGEYESRGVELKKVSSGYRFQVRTEIGEWVSRLWDEKPPRYSRALLETLALVAYRQPITRGEIEAIRGVSVSSHIMRSLLERDWVRVVGHRDVPGRPAMYATTRGFLDYFNLSNLDELPSLAEIRDFEKINEELELMDHGSAQAKLIDKTASDPEEIADVQDDVQGDEHADEQSGDNLEQENISQLGNIESKISSITFKELADKVPGKDSSVSHEENITEEAQVSSDV